MDNGNHVKYDNDDNEFKKSAGKCKKTVFDLFIYCTTPGGGLAAALGQRGFS